MTDQPSDFVSEVIAQNKAFLDKATSLSNELVVMETKLNMAEIGLEFYRNKCESHFNNSDLHKELTAHYTAVLKMRSEGSPGE